MTKQKEIVKQLKKLEKMKNYSQVREQSIDMMKAVIILVHHSIQEKIPKKRISNFFSVNASKLKHKVWHYLNGFNDGNKQNLRYLNAQEEEELVEEIKQHEDAQDALNLHEVIEIVFLKYSLTLQGLWDGTWKNVECIRKNGDSL
jgi:hypothetical protein